MVSCRVAAIGLRADEAQQEHHVHNAAASSPHEHGGSYGLDTLRDNIIDSIFHYDGVGGEAENSSAKAANDYVEDVQKREQFRHGRICMMMISQELRMLRTQSLSFLYVPCGRQHIGVLTVVSQARSFYLFVTQASIT